MASTRGKKTSPVLLLVLAVLMIVISAKGLTQYTHCKKLCTQTTTGSVTDVTRSHSRRGGTKYRATVSYSAGNGTYTVRTASSSHYFTRGEQVRVMYSPGEPSLAYTPDYKDNPIFTLIIGLVLFGIGGWGAAQKLLVKKEAEFY